MWTKLRHFPWRATFAVIWHGSVLILDAARVLEHSGLLKTTQIEPVLLVACALADVASAHPGVPHAA